MANQQLADPKMNEWLGFPLLFLFLGGCVGAGLGWAVFATGLYPHFRIAVIALTLLGSTVSFFVGMALRKRVSLQLSRGFGVVAIGFLLVGGLLFIFFGFQRHSTSTIFDGLLYASGAVALLIRHKGRVVAAIALTALGAICVTATAVTGSFSWLIIIGLFAMFVFIDQLARRDSRMT